MKLDNRDIPSGNIRGHRRFTLVNSLGAFPVVQMGFSGKAVCLLYLFIQVARVSGNLDCPKCPL